MSDKESAVSNCYEERDLNSMWGLAFRRRLWPYEEVQYEELLILLSNIFLCAETLRILEY